MKTEYREVLVKQPVYIAEDGTEFEDEDACCDYEFNMSKATLTFYDSCLHETDCVDECMFVDLRTDADVARFVDILDTCGNSDDGIDKPGLYIWWSPEEKWLNMTEAIAKIRGGANNDQA